jgi:recombination protein RecR
MSKLLYPSAFEDLIASLKMLPGIGTKSAERMAYQILDMDEEVIERFASSLIKVKHDIHHCHICGLMAQDETCDICKSSMRDQSLVCLVQNSKDVYAIEKSEGYNGLYHVLNGVISSVNGKSVDDLNIDSLLERIDKGIIKEVILATNPTIEGEVTALYISELLKDKGVVVSRLAYGLPVGAHLDYADELTLNRALQGRRKITDK